MKDSNNATTTTNIPVDKAALWENISKIWIMLEPVKFVICYDCWFAQITRREAQKSWKPRLMDHHLQLSINLSVTIIVSNRWWHNVTSLPMMKNNTFSRKIIIIMLSYYIMFTESGARYLSLKHHYREAVASLLCPCLLGTKALSTWDASRQCTDPVSIPMHTLNDIKHLSWMETNIKIGF